MANGTGCTVNLPRAEPLMVDSATVMGARIFPTITDTTSVTTPSDSKIVYLSISNPTITAVKESGLEKRIIIHLYIVLQDRFYSLYYCRV